MSIDISGLNCKELLELKSQINERVQNIKELRVYRISFEIGFSVNEHLNDDLSDPESFGDWFVNCSVYDEIQKSFNIPDSYMSGCDVINLDPKDFPNYYKEIQETL